MVGFASLESAAVLASAVNRPALDTNSILTSGKRGMGEGERGTERES